MRVVAADLRRLETTHDARRTAVIRVDPPPRELEATLARSIASTARSSTAHQKISRARASGSAKRRKHVMDKLGAILGSLDQTERAPDAAVTVRGRRYVIPIRSDRTCARGGIVHDESATAAPSSSSRPRSSSSATSYRRGI